jgi:DNA-binding NtrC family response regulator
VIDRVGGAKPVPVDIRILATSNRNLADEVKKGSFREDLLYRLNVVNLKIPALRDRPQDVLELAAHFAKKYAKANGIAERPLSDEVKKALAAARWPGNVRELENAMHRAVLLATGPEIGPEALRTPDGASLDSLALSQNLAAQAAATAEALSRSFIGRTVADVERELILQTLDHCLGNRTHASNILGISIRTLRNKLNQYSDEGHRIPPPPGAEARAVGF